MLDVSRSEFIRSSPAFPSAVLLSLLIGAQNVGDAELDEKGLVERIQQEAPYGTAAFRELVERFTPMLRSRALRLVGNLSDAEEVLQDVFMRVFRAIGRFEADRPLRHWLYAITSNSARNLLRTRSREKRRMEELARELAVQSGAPPPDALFLDRSLDDALDALEPTTRMAIALRFIEGATFPEIARDLEIGESAAKMRVRRGLEQLRKRLKEE